MKTFPRSICVYTLPQPNRCKLEGSFNLPGNKNKISRFYKRIVRRFGYWHEALYALKLNGFGLPIVCLDTAVGQAAALVKETAIVFDSLLEGNLEKSNKDFCIFRDKSH